MRRSTQKTLDKAHQAIEIFGWRTGQNGDTHVGFCLFGAVKHVTRLRPLSRLRATQELRRRIFESSDMTIAEMFDAMFSYGDSKLMTWNDQHLYKDAVLKVLE